MPYFEEHHNRLALQKSDSEGNGFRNNQIGAIFAIGAHFTLNDTPAIVTMPTGSGKTATLISSAFLLHPLRVLVLTPSVMVRDQTAYDFETLKTLKRIRALPDGIPTPNVFTVKSRIASSEAWDNLRDYDVVVATPHTVSPSYTNVPLPPEDLFQLVLVDEAHHEPASTWNAILDSLPYARRVLFTATPYRSDRKEIRGSYIYTYPTRRAFQEGIFGSVQLQAVVPQEGETADIAIARGAEMVLMSDRANGLSHFLLARARSKDHAMELKALYDAQTQLKLELVYSKNTYQHNARILNRLADSELDGIITVDMLSEGVDLPRLKVGAIHAPHKSLAVTLQFIGRFARTTDPSVGDATFVAVPDPDLSSEVNKLYQEDAVWEEIVPTLGDERIRQEIDTQGFLGDFESRINVASETEDFSLYALRPYHHVKVYELDRTVDITQKVSLKSPFEVIHQTTHATDPVTVFVGRQTTKPRWTKSISLNQFEYHLFIAFYDSVTSLLFLHSSFTKSETLYEELKCIYAPEGATPVPFNTVNRALRNLDDLTLYNVGLRKTSKNMDESYRTITGPRADRIIHKNDSRTHHRGHLSGSASENGSKLTIGVSSAAKVWSNTTDQLPQFIAWCKQLGAKMRDESPFITNSNIDYIGVGDKITSIPNHNTAVLASWNEDVYDLQPILSYVVAGFTHQVQLLDLALLIDVENASNSHLTLVLETAEREYRLLQQVGETCNFTLQDDSVIEPQVVFNDGRQFDLLEYLRSHPPSIMFANQSRLIGNEVYQRTEYTSFDVESIEVFDWPSLRVDTHAEISGAKAGLLSIHEFMSKYLVEQDFDIVFYDHGAYEMADFVCVKLRDDAIMFTFYHAKKSGGKNPGERVGDIYEVCCQVARSIRHTTGDSKRQLFENMSSRCDSAGSTFLKGTLDELRGLVDASGSRMTLHELVLVQPGISKAKVSDNTDNVFGAVSHFIEQTCEPLRVLGSA